MANWPDYDNETKVAWEDCVCVGETERAVKVSGVEDNPVWIPKSQIHDDSEVYCLEDSGTMIVKRWWAEKQGWV